MYIEGLEECDNFAHENAIEIHDRILRLIEENNFEQEESYKEILTETIQDVCQKISKYEINRLNNHLEDYENHRENLDFLKIYLGCISNYNKHSFYTEAEEHKKKLLELF